MITENFSFISEDDTAVYVYKWRPDKGLAP
ncbi:MAG: hypothetical protein PWR12_570, partial [Eubacteriaceae bacterium]|nr:hypothetical protein [Eubacteriaceae bacterium]